MPSLRDWGRAIWCRIFFGTSPRYLPSRTKIKVKGVGQECPTHTSKVTNNVNGSGRGRPLHAIKTRVKGDGQECPTHMIKKPGAEARLDWDGYAALKRRSSTVLQWFVGAKIGDGRDAPHFAGKSVGVLYAKCAGPSLGVARFVCDSPSSG